MFVKHQYLFLYWQIIVVHGAMCNEMFSARCVSHHYLSHRIQGDCILLIIRWMQILQRLIVNRRAFNRSLSYKRPLNGVHLTVSCTAKSRYLKSDSYFIDSQWDMDDVPSKFDHSHYLHSTDMRMTCCKIKKNTYL